MSFQEKIVLNPIGYVKTTAKGEEVKDNASFSEVVLRDDLVEGLSGILGFSHLFVLFYLNQITIEQRRTLKVHPRGRQDMPLTGVFAARTMLRPNPIGLTLVELVGPNTAWPFPQGPIPYLGSSIGGTTTMRR